ncbi:MAG: CoA-binding protein [Chloroflexi bacterium]|nr:CoA-binding protein [Chloroflexota bacterium]
MTIDRADTRRLADLLDLHEGRLGVPLLDDAAIRALLATRPRIAIIGASPEPWRPSNGVLRDLVRLGFEVAPVNPTTTVVEGLTCYPTLAAAVEATGPFGIVDVFRRAEACPAHAREAVAAAAGCLWLQLGIASREAGEIAAAGGLAVVMDRCLAIDAARP